MTKFELSLLSAYPVGKEWVEWEKEVTMSRIERKVWIPITISNIEITSHN